MSVDFEFWNRDEECQFFNEYRTYENACTHKENKNGRCVKSRCPLMDDDADE